jgi:hypothetical protein
MTFSFPQVDSVNPVHTANEVPAKDIIALQKTVDSCRPAKFPGPGASWETAYFIAVGILFTTLITEYKSQERRLRGSAQKGVEIDGNPQRKAATKGSPY